MFSFIKAAKRCLSTLEIRFYCRLLAFSICASVAISYWQYRSAIQDISTNIETHITVARQELNDSFDSYDAIFNIISSRLNRGGERLAERNISDLLNKFHTTREDPNSTKIKFLDINW